MGRVIHKEIKIRKVIKLSFNKEIIQTMMMIQALILT